MSLAQSVGHSASQSDDEAKANSYERREREWTERAVGDRVEGNARRSNISADRGELNRA